MKKGKKVSQIKLPPEAFERVEVECPTCGHKNMTAAVCDMVVCANCKGIFYVEPEFVPTEKKEINDPRRVKPV